MFTSSTCAVTLPWASVVVAELDHRHGRSLVAVNTRNAIFEATLILMQNDEPRCKLASFCHSCVRPMEVLQGRICLPGRDQSNLESALWYDS